MIRIDGNRVRMSGDKSVLTKEIQTMYEYIYNLDDHTPVKIDGKWYDTAHIMSSEYRGHYAYITFSDGYIKKVRIRERELEEILTEVDGFIVCSRGAILNTKFVKATFDTEVILTDERRLPISRSRKKEVKNLVANDRYYTLCEDLRIHEGEKQ